MTHKLVMQIAIIGMICCMWFLLNYKIDNVMNEVRDIKEDQEIMSNEIGYVYDDIEALSNYVTYHEKVGHDELENNEENE
tara:strand:+ start:236 stop:475 length:240 start_codon:yes stop_codon:yes gene_type:complete